MTQVLPQQEKTLIKNPNTNIFLFNVYNRIINQNFLIREMIDTSPFFEKLMLCYEEPVAEKDGQKIPRTYHNLFHILEGVQKLATIEEECQCGSVSDVLLAWFYHDSYYKTDIGSNNEFKSASYAFSDLLEMGWSAERAGRIFDLIMWTKHDKNPPEHDFEANLIVDLDIMRMAVSREKFIETSNSIRHEFSLFDDKQWKEGRIKFFTGFKKLKDGRVFRTPNFQPLNEIAILNIQGEINRLSSDWPQS